MHSAPDPMLQGVLLDEMESLCSRLSSNLSYDLLEWITWPLDEQTAVKPSTFQR